MLYHCTHFDALLTSLCRWAYGVHVCLWEIFSFGKCISSIALSVFPYSTVLLYIASKHHFLHVGDLPYSELGNTVILSRVMAGYRLDCPEGCPDDM